MADWKPALEPRHQHGATIQTVRAAITNETGHDVTVDGRTLRVLPDGRTTSRKRSWVISEALAVAHAVQANQKPLIHDGEVYVVDPITYVTGALVLAGATNLWLDDQPLNPTPAVPAVDLRISPTGDGQGVEVRLLNGGRS